MADNHRRPVVLPGLFRHLPGKGLINRPIAVFPSVMDGGVHRGIVGRMPHIVLQKPQQRIAQHIVMLMIDPPRRNDITQVYAVAGQGRGARIAAVGNPAVALAHRAGNPGKGGGLRQAVEGGYNAGIAAAGLHAALGSQIVFHRAPVAAQDQGAAAQQVVAQLAQVSHKRLPRDFPISD